MSKSQKQLSQILDEDIVKEKLTSIAHQIDQILKENNAAGFITVFAKKDDHNLALLGQKSLYLLPFIKNESGKKLEFRDFNEFNGDRAAHVREIKDSLNMIGAMQEAIKGTQNHFSSFLESLKRQILLENFKVSMKELP